jgi:hypothetical protein
MTRPYSGSSQAGGGTTAPPQDSAPSTQPDYAVSTDEAGQPHSGSIGTPHTDSGAPDIQGTSVGQLIGEVSKDLSTLMRQELDLAKVEVKAEVRKAGKGAGMLGAAGFAGYMVLLFLSLALMWGLANVMDAGLAALIVAVLWGVIAAITFAMGRKKLRHVNPKPERTADTLQQVPGALKPH